MRCKPELPAPRDSRVNVRITTPQRLYLKAEAAKRRTTISVVVEECLLKGLKLAPNEWDELA